MLTPMAANLIYRQIGGERPLRDRQRSIAVFGFNALNWQQLRMSIVNHTCLWIRPFAPDDKVALRPDLDNFSTARSNAEKAPGFK